jgi:hypothetical protein
MRLMVPAQADSALIHRQAVAPAAVVALGAALALFQATSLLLAPADERQIAISLSTPSSLDLSLPAPPASQVLQLGQAVAGRVERSLASIAVLAAGSLPALSSASRTNLASGTAIQAAVGQAPAPAAPATQPGGSSRPAHHSTPVGHAGAPSVVPSAHAAVPASPPATHS